ncbi:MAG: hypothetical protein BMS9Abin02_2009 [Anaerolineae bacterium]|nr:MAG: hypothetical protein BMS9Abin02_2009 [Anaerolineae bacterium]
MKQPLKFSFVLLTLTVFVFAAVVVGGPDTLRAQEDDDGGQTGSGQPVPPQPLEPAGTTDDDPASIYDIGSLFPGSLPASSLDVTEAAFDQSDMDIVDASVDGFLYVFVADTAANGNNRIYGYEADNSTGALSLISGFPVNVGQSGSSSFWIGEMMAYDGTNGVVYVANDVEDTLSAYSVDMTTGAIIEKVYSPATLGAGLWDCVNVHPNGSPVIVADFNGSVASLIMTPGSALPAAGSPFSANGALPFGCALSQDGGYYYAGGSADSLIAEFSINEPIGVLSHLAGSPYNSGIFGNNAFATDSDGRLFVSSWRTGDVGAFTSTNGILTAVSGNPFASSVGGANDFSGAGFGLLHPSNYFMVADRALNQVAVFQIAGSGTATTLTEVTDSPFATGFKDTHVLALNSTSSFLYAANASSRNITTFSVNASNGKLTDEGTQAANALGATGRIQGMAFVPIPDTQLKFYSDKSVFIADFPGATLEDFEDSKAVGNTPQTCNTPVDKDSSDPCFDPGDIVDGVQFIANPPISFAFVAIDAGFNGEPLTSKTIGTSSYGTLDIVFPDNAVYALGGDFISWFFANDSFLFTIYGPGGKLLGTVTSDVLQSGTFWGVATVEYISRVNVSALKPIATLKYEGFDNIAFGKNAADFTGSPTSGRVNHSVTFINKSKGAFSSCLWTFGDGAQSSSCGNPSHTYKKPGIYNVKLTVSGLGGSNTRTRSSYITVDNVVADFTASPTSGPVNLTVKFTNKSLGDYTSCSWDFGDSSNSTTCGNPTHTYKKTGTKTITLTVSGPGFSDPQSKTIVVQDANVFVPLSVGDFCGGFNGPREKEPNNVPSSANGPLCFFRTYKGSPDNDHPELESDWFYFTSNGGAFTVNVTKFLKSNAQVLLYYQNSGNLVTFKGDQASGSYILSHNGPAGKYLVRVVAGAGHPKGNGDYSLKVTAP